ncbi:MAG: hypothetical protein WCW66_02805 [Patescibacteria group bacterium]
MKTQSKKTNKDLFIVIIIIVSICLFGILVGYFYSQLPENNPQKNQSNCEKAGGVWEKNSDNCLLSYKADGEICTDGGQCQSGICFPPALSEAQMVTLEDEELSGIIGTCYTDDSAEGCVKQVIDGAVSMQSLCY